MVLPEIKNDILYVDFRIKEVYPKPDCRATFSENKVHLYLINNIHMFQS